MYVIWNLTNFCPWNCSFCCMSAIKIGHINKRKILNFSEKIRVLEILASHNLEIDFSGGDPLYSQEDFTVVEKATQMLPKSLIDVSMTGCDFTNKKLNLLKKVGKVEISIDNVPENHNPFRPTGFNLSAINLLKILVKEGIFCSAVTTLYPLSSNKDNLRNLYNLLCFNHVPEWDILRFYPVGRGLRLSNLYLDDSEILELMDFLDSLEGTTKIIFQHSLQLLRREYKCHAVIETFGILPNGIINACAWALDENSNPLPDFYLGKLPEDDLEAVLNRARIQLRYNERKCYCRVMNQLKNRGHI